MAQQNSKPFKVLVPKVWQGLYVDTVVSERLRVLAEAKAVEPLRDVFGHAAAPHHIADLARVYGW